MLSAPRRVLGSFDSYLSLIRRTEGNLKCTVMGDLVLESNAAKGLVEHIRLHRRNVVAVVLQSSSTARQGSVAASLFVNALLDRFALECETLDRNGLDTWISEFETAAPTPDYSALILLTFASLSASFAGSEGPMPEIVRHLVVRGNNLGSIVSQARSKRLREHFSEATEVVAKTDVLASLWAALEAHDPIAAEHCRAVGEWCRRIAEAMNMNPEGVRFVSLCGSLHDVGKTATPLEILSKAGPLTNLEWDVMRDHAEQSARIAGRVPSLKEIEPIVRAHHERYDGFGYPDRLKGAEIPIAARIIAAADAFNAMISHRPYRKAMSVTQAVETLMEGRGTQWDPKIVDVLITTVKPQASLQNKKIATDVKG